MPWTEHPTRMVVYLLYTKGKARGEFEKYGIFVQKAWNWRSKKKTEGGEKIKQRGREKKVYDIVKNVVQ